MFVGAILGSTLKNIESKVDVNVYFVKSASEDNIQGLIRSVRALPEVSEVAYTSRDQALKEFRDRHQNDELTLAALDELGDNPLGATMSVKAKDPAQYVTIVKYIQNQAGADAQGPQIIDRVNYEQNKGAIDALTRIIAASRKLGLAVIAFFVVVSILITFNTIRLAIYIFREEISVMRLVGASEMYIRGPFVAVGIMYGLVAGVITLLFLWPISYWMGPLTENMGTGLNLYSYYGHNIFQILLIVIGSGLVLGGVSSYLAVRRYLKNTK